MSILCYFVNLENFSNKSVSSTPSTSGSTGRGTSGRPIIISSCTSTSY